MNRTLKIDIYDNYVLYNKNNTFMQLDKETCYLQVNFFDEYSKINWSNKTMVFNFIRPDGKVVFSPETSPSNSINIKIPTNAISQIGIVDVEIVIKQEDTHILTINKLVSINVNKTVAGSSAVIIPSADLENELSKLISDLDDVTKAGEAMKNSLITNINKADNYNVQLENKNKVAQDNLNELQVENPKATESISNLKQEIAKVPAMIKAIEDDSKVHINIIRDEGATQVGKITSEGTKQIGAIDSETTRQINTIKVEGQNQVDAIKNISADTIVQLPHSSFIGGIRAKQGVIETSGIFDKIKGIKNASSFKYGNNTIITTPNNSFNAVVTMDGVYIDNTYTNIMVKEYFPAYHELVYNDNSIKITINKVRSGLLIGEFDIATDKKYTVTMKTIGFDVYANPHPTLANRIKDYNVVKEGDYTIITFTGVQTASGISFEFLTDKIHQVGDVLYIKDMMIVPEEYTYLKPAIPMGYTFPQGALSFEVEGINGDNSSFIGKNFINKSQNSIYYFSTYHFSLYSNSPPQKDFAYSALGGINCRKDDNANVFTRTNISMRAMADTDYDDTRQTGMFSELLVYNTPLTKLQLESEFSKKIVFSGTSNINEKVKNNFPTYTNLNTDFNLTNNAFYDILSPEGHFSNYINGNGTITGDKIKNVAGKIRVNDITTPFKLKIREV